MKLIYKINPNYLLSTRDDKTRVISMDVEDSDMFVLKGPCAHAVNYFDGKTPLADVKLNLEKNLGVKGSTEDFGKMVNFLLDKQIIVSA